MVCAPFVLYVALTHAPHRTVRDRSTIVQPLGALHIVYMLCARIGNLQSLALCGCPLSLGEGGDHVVCRSEKESSSKAAGAICIAGAGRSREASLQQFSDTNLRNRKSTSCSSCH